MAEDSAAPNLNLSPEERRVFAQLFRQADTENVGVVTGEIAVKFFEKTRLEPRVLGEIWQIADKENRGFLTPAGFGIVLRLIGHYQAGRDPTPELALRPAPLPKFEGAASDDAAIQPPPGPPPSALQPQGSGAGAVRVPPLTPDKAAQYAALFEKSGAQNGSLPGEQAKQIFERAGLPNEVLGRIWNLADTEQRGALTATEFVIAMHLLASFKNGSMRILPNVLPAGLYEAAARRPPSRQSSGPGAMSAIPRQLSGMARGGSPLSRPAYNAPPQQYVQQPGFGNDWLITPAEKSTFDGIYATLDKSNKGYITGDEAVPFFSESKLPEEALAQIWDLADINSAGSLTRDEFAVAMYLIRQQRSKRDGRDQLPATLPANLIPPSMRNQARPANVPTAPAFEAPPPPTMPKSAAEDLFGLDALSSPPPPAAAQIPDSTGGSSSFGAQNDPFASRAAASPTASPPPSTSTFKPFAPVSTFGQALSYNNQPGPSNNPSSSQPRAAQQPSAMEDLLGDNDPEISKKLTNETTELANLSNQVGTLSKQMQEVQGQRATSQGELTQASSQKREFETRLSSLRTLYEKEVQAVKSLGEELANSRKETKKLQTDIAMIEGTYQDLQNQHRQNSAALQADQQENASLKERIRVTNAEIAQLKPALEKLRSDARQQKGLVAINKKQLATNEAEREKLKAEAEELNKSIEEDKKELAAAAKVQSPPVVSPAPSSMSANNPFFRRQGSTGDATLPFSSPSASIQQDRSFDNVFGPSFQSATTPKESVPATASIQDAPAPSAAFPSRTFSGSGGDFPSPPAFTPSRELANEPPPPPASRQISSSVLPFPAAEHEESLSSSRQVSAPNSRFGETSTGANTPTNYMGTTPTTGSSAAGGPVEAARAVSPGLDRKSNASPANLEHTDSIPGAFPGDSNSHIVATPTGGSTLSEQEAADPFAARKEPTRSGTAKEDFDAAFAGFGNTTKPQERSNTGNSSGEGSGAAGSSSFHKEFPPIAELENDDDSDSASEAAGFDDDFAPGSPGHTRNTSSTYHAATAEDYLGPKFGDKPAAPTGSAEPPTPNAQASPPSYDKVASPSDRAQSEVQEFSGLLPKREDPTSPVTVTENTAAPSQSSGGPALFGAPPTTFKSAMAEVPVKDSFGDDFDEFDDLEEAKEGDADEDFANVSGHERSGHDDFNPMFDSPPAPPAKSLGPPMSSAAFGSSSAFGQHAEPPRASTQHAPSDSTTTVNDSHDWDAIFAGLDNPSMTVAAATAEPAKPLGNGTSSAAPERPQIGRALTEAGEHDDPILKELTGMGYPRKDALTALEKYDYNLERAANYLASQS